MMAAVTPYYPIEWVYLDSDATGPTSTYTAVGMGLEVEAGVMDDLSIFSSYEANFGAQSRSVVMSSIQLGMKYCVFGSHGISARHPHLRLKVYSPHTLSVIGGFRRSVFDYSWPDEESGGQIIIRENNVEMKGKFFGPLLGIQYDYLLADSIRAGLRVSTSLSMLGSNSLLLFPVNSQLRLSWEF